MKDGKRRNESYGLTEGQERGEKIDFRKSQYQIRRNDEQDAVNEANKT